MNSKSQKGVQLNLIKAEQELGDQIHGLISRALGSYGLYHLRPRYVDDDINDLDLFYFNNSGYFWVLRDQSGRVFGSCAIFKIDDETCELRKMYLDLSLQGKGWGRLMFGNALAQAKLTGYKKMVLKTNSKLRTALALYRKYGFKDMSIDEADRKADCDVAMYLLL